MTNPMLAELDEVVRLMDSATPGEWYWNEYTANLVTDKPGDGQEFEIAAVYSEHDDDREPANSAAICAAMHFLRTHHATLADMAKRLEAAERDARGEREETWEVWQDGMAVAGSDSLADAQHYLLMYGQDGPVKLVRVVTYRSDAIDATQEGEG